MSGAAPSPAGSGGAAGGPRPGRRVAALGIVTIAAYGGWYYGFGVLLGPLVADTGWPEAALLTVYGVANLGWGLGAAFGGAFLDRFGPRRVLALTGTLGAAALAVAAVAPSLGAFAPAFVVAGTVIGSGGFYHVTQPSAVRIAGGGAAGARAIAHLTVWGAFASPIFLPALGAALEVLDWRQTLLLVAALVAVVFLLAAAAMPAGLRPAAPASRGGLAPLRAALGDAAIRRFLLVVFVGGMGYEIVLVYQVPLMVSAGLSLAVASSIAGLRGLMQLGGRLPLPWLLRRHTSLGLMGAAFVAIAASSGVLLFAGDLLPALLFAVLAGVGIGALPPLEGIYASEVFDPDHLGKLMGSQYLLLGVSGFLGPALAGWAVALSGTRSTAALLAAGFTIAAAGILIAGARRRPAVAGSG